MSEMTEIPCPSCQGSKGGIVHIHFANVPDRWEWRTCSTCGGTGTISQEIADRIQWGEAIREDRKTRLASLKDEAKRLGVSYVELSHAENGRADRELMAKISEARKESIRAQQVT